MQAAWKHVIPAMNMGGRHDETPVRFHPFVFAAFLYLSFSVNYPGHLNPDSLEQLVWAAHPQQMTDWHSPVVTWLWSMSGPLLGQPAGALMIQCLCMSFFVAVLPVFPQHNARTLSLLFAEGFFRLALVAIAGIVIKDVLLACLILAILAALQLSRSSGNRSRWLGIAATAFIAVLLVRPTNFLMVLIMWALISPILFRNVRSYLLALIVVCVLLVCVVPATDFVNRVVLGAQNARAQKQLIIFDIAGMSKHTGQNLFATLPEWPVATLPPPIPCYNPKRWDPYFFLGDCKGYDDAFDVASKQTRSGLTGWWFEQVIRHPVAYLQHRLAYSRKLIRTDQHIIFPRAPYSDTLNSTLDPRDRDPNFNAEILETRGLGAAHIDFWPNTVAEEPFAKISSLLFGWRNAYILSAVMCLVLWAWTMRRHFTGREVDPTATLAAATGLGNIGMLMLFGVASEGRYLLTTICCAWIALLIALRPRIQHEQAPAA